MLSFEVGREYTLRELHILLGLPEDATGGGWFNGFQRHGGAYCVFASVRADSRRPDRRDHWEDDVLFWSAKGTTRLADEPIRELVSGRWPVHVFWRRWRRGHEGGFTYAGIGIVKETRDTVPATILWTCVPPSLS